jgi:methionine sulfoxide reductase heme-binding subunit
MTDPSQYLFWITSRAAGTSAMILASASVGVGLAMGGRLLRFGGRDHRNIHETLSLSVMAAIAVHALTLIGDKTLHPTVLDVTVPFAFSYKTLPTSIGIVAGWGMILLGLSYYVRGRIGIQRWKLIHRFTAVAWIGGLVHTFAEGTDAGQLWFIALILLTAAPAAVLLVMRLTQRRSPGPSQRPGPTPRTRQALRSAPSARAARSQA